MRHCRHLAAALLTLASVARAQDPLLTVAESSDYKRTATHSEVMALCERIAKAAPRARLDSIGESHEGRSLPLLLLADPPVERPRDVGERMLVLLFGNIHAGEVCGKEALLRIARELALDGDSELLERLVIAIVPILNADGNERVSKENRPGQVGPEEGMGERRNAQGLDLNRDWVKLDAPETRAIVRFMNEWDPLAIVDTHTTNGSIHRYGLTYAGPKHPAGDPRLIEYVRDEMLPDVTRRLRGKGLETYFYGNFADDHTRWTTYPDLPRYGTPYRGLRHRIAILSEAYAYSTFKQRVLDTRLFVLELLEYLAEKREEVTRVVREARPPETIALRTEVRAFAEKVTVLGRDEPAMTPRDYEVELVNDFVATLEVARPRAYLVPRSLDGVLAKLREHGIAIDELREDVELDLEFYRIDEVHRDESEREGHRRVRVEASARGEAVMVRAGEAIVRTDGQLGALARYLLEPEATDGLCSWNFLDDAIAEGANYPIRRVVDDRIDSAFASSLPAPARPSEKRALTFESVYESESPPSLHGFTRRAPRWLEAERWLESDDDAWLEVEARTGRVTRRWAKSAVAAALETLPAIDGATAKRLASGTRFSPSGFLLEHGDDLYHCGPTEGEDGFTAARLTSSPEREELATLSPDGELVAFVRENDLWTVDVATRTSRRLTVGGSDTLRRGKASWVYFEEVFGRDWQAYWWSPDSRRIAFFETDSSDVETFMIVDDLQNRQTLERSTYPKPGERNPTVRVGVVSVAGGAVRWADLSDYDASDLLVTGVVWKPDSRGACLFLQNRIQTYLDLSVLDAGGGKPRRLLRETTEAWVEQPTGPLWLKDGSFLLTSERTGWRHVYHFDSDGELQRALTSGEWEVRRVHNVDEERGAVWVSGTRDSHIATKLYRVALDGSAITRVTGSPGTHRVETNPTGTLVVDSSSTSRRAGTARLLDTKDGAVVRTIDSNPVHDLERVVWCPTELLEIPARDGFPLHASLTKPRDFDPERRYPVWFMTYGGPHAQTVRNAWSYNGVWDQVLVQSGIVVFRCDPRSASGRGAVSTWSAYRRLGVRELEDITDAIHWLRGHDWVDGERIGMSGHSYGGFMTSYAMTHSTLFAAGIAGAPVTDWRDYDTIYTERYMQTPQLNPEGYAETSVVAAAGKLHGRLLIAHGLIDDNVHVQNATRLIRALQDAGKTFELMVYPGSRHGIRAAHYRRLRYDFIRRSLGVE